MQYQRGNTKSEILSSSTCGKIDFDFTTKKKNYFKSYYRYVIKPKVTHNNEIVIKRITKA